MGIIGAISDKIKFEEKELEAINERKKEARSIDSAKNMLLEYEKQKLYIKGLRDALVIIEKG
jgi:hypothetical protein